MEVIEALLDELATAPAPSTEPLPPHPAVMVRVAMIVKYRVSIGISPNKAMVDTCAA